MISKEKEFYYEEIIRTQKETYQEQTKEKQDLHDQRIEALTLKYKNLEISKLNKQKNELTSKH